MMFYQILLILCVLFLRDRFRTFKILFVLIAYERDLKYHKIGYHVYADATQLYISFKCKQPLESISKVNSCLSDIRRWMIINKLKINDAKIEFIVLRSPQL